MNLRLKLLFSVLVSINLSMSAGITDWLSGISPETKQEIVQATRTLGAGITTGAILINGLPVTQRNEFILAGLGFGNALNVLYPTSKDKFKRLLLTAIGFCIGGALRAKNY